MYLHLALNLCPEGVECISGDGAAGRTYLFGWTMRAAHHGLFGLPVAAPRLPPVVAPGIPLPVGRPVHGPRDPRDRGVRPRGRSSPNGGFLLFPPPSLPPPRPARRGVGRSKATAI